MQKVFLILFFLVSLQTAAQQNRVKIGVLIIPSGAGFLIGDAGYERLNKTLNKSWQFHLNASGGEIALDAGNEKRISEARRADLHLRDEIERRHDFRLV